MAVQPNDILVLKAAAQNGGAVTGTTATGINALFDGGFSAVESAAGVVEYACAYILNSAAQTAFDVSFYVSNKDVFEAVNVRVGIGASAVDVTEPATADNTTAPDGVVFSNSIDALTPLVIGDLAANEFKSIWFEFTLPAGTSAVDYDYDITVDAETGA
jgi:hypothetical protein